MAIAIWSLVGGLVVGFMATSGGDVATDFEPLRTPIVGVIGAFVVGGVAGVIARWRRMPRQAAWPWAIAGSGLGFGLGGVLGVLLEPKYVHATQLAFIAELSAVALGGVAIATAAFLLVSSRPAAGSMTGRSGRIGPVIGVVIGVAFPVAFTAFVAANPSDHFYDPSLPTIRITILGSSLTFDPTTVPAGRVNLALTVHAATCANPSEAAALGLDASLQMLVLTGAEPNTGTSVPAGPSSTNGVAANPTAPVPTLSDSVVFLPPGDVVDYPIDGAIVLRPGPITWTCGTTTFTTAAR
jgi:hypothetical protein